LIPLGLNHQAPKPYGKAVNMKISNHLLQGDPIQKVGFTATPNKEGTFAQGLPDTIIIHYTAGKDAASAIKTLVDPGIKASAHLVVGRDGSITQLVPFNEIAWHAGKSAYEVRTGLNAYSLGIEIDNAGRLAGGGGDCLHHLVELLASDCDLEAQLGQEIHRVFGAAINLHVTLLPSITLDLVHGHAVNAEAGEGVAHLVELERFDDHDDQLHDFPSRQIRSMAPDLVRKPGLALD